MWMRQGRLFRVYVALWLVTGLLALLVLVLRSWR